MIVVGTELIDEFCKGNESAKKAFDKWLPKVEDARWTKRLDAKATFPATDPWTSDRGTEYLIIHASVQAIREWPRSAFPGRRRRSRIRLRGYMPTQSRGHGARHSVADERNRK